MTEQIKPRKLYFFSLQSLYGTIKKHLVFFVSVGTERRRTSRP